MKHQLLTPSVVSSNNETMMMMMMIMDAMIITANLCDCLLQDNVCVCEVYDCTVSFHVPCAKSQRVSFIFQLPGSLCSRIRSWKSALRLA